MLANLAPARRRLVIAIAALTLTLILAAGLGITAALTADSNVEPVAQGKLGPVLLVPGYGGSTTSLEVLAVALEAEGRQTTIVSPPGDGRGDLREQAEGLAEIADQAIEDGAPSVDVIGYSAGGVVARVWVAELGGDAIARRVVTLASPHHGTELAGLASDLSPESCPEGCQQLAPDSDLLRSLNADDETPDGPEWVALWTSDDQTVVPPSSGELEGALTYSIQTVCPALTVAHADVPRTPAVIAMVESALAVETPAAPSEAVCTASP